MDKSAKSRTVHETGAGPDIGPIQADALADGFALRQADALALAGGANLSLTRDHRPGGGVAGGHQPQRYWRERPRGRTPKQSAPAITDTAAPATIDLIGATATKDPPMAAPTGTPNAFTLIEMEIARPNQAGSVVRRRSEYIATLQGPMHLPEEWVQNLEAFVDPDHSLDDVAAVLAELADHAQQAVYRPGSWERGWLCQALGYEWLDDLEPDPERPDIFERPRPREEG